MPITFRCTCGKVMQAKDEYAGRQVKCGGCGMIVLIPGGDAAPTLPHVRSSQMPAVPAGYGDNPASIRPTPPARPDERRSPERDDWDRRDSRPRRQGMATWVKILIVCITLGILGGGVLILILALSGKGASQQFAMVPRDAAIVVTVRVGDLWNSKSLETVKGTLGFDLARKMKEETGVGPDDLERVTVVMPDFPDMELRGRRPAREPDFWIIVHTKTAIDKEAVMRKIVPDRREQSAGGKTYFTSSRGPDAPAVHFASEKEAWLSTPRVLASLLDGSRKIATDGPLSDTIALASSNKHHIVVGVQFPEKTRDILLADASRELPRFPFKDLLGGTATFDGSGSGDLEYRIKFAKAESAGEATGAIKVGLDAALGDLRRKGGGPDMPPGVLPTLEKMITGVKVETKGTEVVMTMAGAGEAIGLIVNWFTMAVGDVAVAGDRMHATNNVKQMLLGMHLYHDVEKSLPPARFRGGLSWRVAILPYIDQVALYNEFRLDEPWDSAHNIKLLDRMPDIFRPVGGPLGGPPAKPGYTCYQVFTGGDMVFDSFGPGRYTKLFAIPDGTSNTVFIAEGANLVPWTAPQDMFFDRFDRFGPPPRLGYQFPGVFIAGYGDTTVEVLPTSLTRDELKFIIDPADGRGKDDLRLKGK